MITSLRICCTGSIGIIDLPRLILTLRLAYQTDIRCFLTRSAETFVTKQTFSAVSGNLAIASGDDFNELSDVPLLIAPASANALSALAIGDPSHIAARLAMSSSAPVFVCPAMNQIMWSKPAIRRATDAISQFGYEIIGPGDGIEVDTMTPSPSALSSVDTIIDTLLTKLPWARTR